MKSSTMNMTSGVTIDSSLIIHKYAQNSYKCHLTTSSPKCPPINPDNKNPLAMSFIPTAKGLVLLL